MASDEQLRNRRLSSLINKGFGVLDEDEINELRNAKKTLIVVGVLMSGTSMAAGVLHHLGVL